MLYDTIYAKYRESNFFVSEKVVQEVATGLKKLLIFTGTHI